jgi:imidazolonepropionase-like amidohydrolase
LVLHRLIPFPHNVNAGSAKGKTMRQTIAITGLPAAMLTTLALYGPVAEAAEAPLPEILFTNVRVYDGSTPTLSAPTNVLVRGNVIAAIKPGLKATAGTQVIDGRGKTLMPGLIDAHVHMTYSMWSQADMLSEGMTAAKLEVRAAQGADDMLMRGFTAVRDLGGPIFSLKAGIDSGKYRGPRIWPSGATISQTSGHGDSRLPTERSRRFFGEISRAEQFGATFIADGRDEVLTASRENLRFGASQLKLMAGGGASTPYDPLDASTYTLDELKAGVDAASDWNTYVTVHAYTPRSIRRAIDAGVKCIEHGQLMDEESAKLIADSGIWLSLQALDPPYETDSAFHKQKKNEVITGTDKSYKWAKKYGIKLAWGTDLLFQPQLAGEQNRLLLDQGQWFTAPEILKMATSTNAQLLALSGPRSPYQGKLGVVEEGALADLLLVNGNPLADIKVLGNPKANFKIIMKDGKIYKNEA